MEEHEEHFRGWGYAAIGLQVLDARVDKEGVALEESPNFVEWLDPESNGFMYTSKQEESWSNPHLKLCHWYIEMPEDDTPLHEEGNCRSAEPTSM